MKIKIYTTPSCPYCHQAKDYLNKKRIQFEEIDVSQDQAKAEEMVKVSGQMGVPVIVADEKVIVGFDQNELEKILSE